MRIATWNINSVRTREERVRAFLERSDVDVLCLQETKCTDTQFPDFTDTGYQQAHFGLHSFNGVAILSRIGLDNIKTDFGQPGFDKDFTAEQKMEARALGVTVKATDSATGSGSSAGTSSAKDSNSTASSNSATGTVEVWSLYVPNGREIRDPHYTYKLRWLDALARYAAKDSSNGGADRLVLAGDFNIAPRDEDVWDRSYFDGKTHVTPRERAALEQLEAAGMEQATRIIEDQYTYWDYQAMRFPKNHGIRIDLQYSKALTATDARVDKEERKGKGASDHAPVIVDYRVDNSTNNSTNNAS